MITLRWSNSGRRFMSWPKELGLRFVRQIRAEREIRVRRLPRLRVTSRALALEAPRENARATVYYLCPDSDRPTGGNRTIYRHVDVLNSSGIPAVVLHDQSGFVCSWFEHNTPVVGAAEVPLTPRDVLVVPEYHGPDLHNLPVGPRVVIFNQGAYITFVGVRSVSPGAPYRGIPGIEAILVVSHDSADYLRYAFPELRIERVRNVVDGNIFHPSASPPGRRVAMMPRHRGAAACAELMHLLRARGCLASWEVVNIDGCSERETAEALRSCAIFLSFSEREGFGMPPAEAMACGCYVIGFTGLGGREFFDPATCMPVEEGNILAFAKTVERALLADEAELQAMRRRALMASARILEEYSPEHQRADLLAFFGSLFSCRGAGASTQALAKCGSERIRDQQIPDTGEGRRSPVETRVSTSARR
jgi:hypothetical protein